MVVPDMTPNIRRSAGKSLPSVPMERWCKSPRRCGVFASHVAPPRFEYRKPGQRASIVSQSSFM